MRLGPRRRGLHCARRVDTETQGVTFRTVRPARIPRTALRPETIPNRTRSGSVQPSVSGMLDEAWVARRCPSCFTRFPCKRERLLTSTPDICRSHFSYPRSPRRLEERCRHNPEVGMIRCRTQQPASALRVSWPDAGRNVLRHGWPCPWRSRRQEKGGSRGSHGRESGEVVSSVSRVGVDVGRIARVVDRWRRTFSEPEPEVRLPGGLDVSKPGLWPDRTANSGSRRRHRFNGGVPCHGVRNVVTRSTARGRSGRHTASDARACSPTRT